jgi:HAD superfamily hydrolase (TIGR01549 family)
MHAPNPELRYDALILDVGGTLIGFPSQTPFREFLAHAGLPATDDDAQAFYHRFIGVTHGERDRAQGLGVDVAALDAWWYGVFEKTWPDRPDLAAEMFRWLRADRFDRLFPESLPALEALQEIGMPLGVVSNFTPDLEDLLRRMGLRDYFDFVIVSSVVGAAKPDPGIFELAVSKACRPSHRLLYVGDHIGDDIEGAWGAGLDAVLIDRGDRQPEALCPRIGSLLDLVDYVREPTNPASAIIFDMDGVVLDSPPTHVLTWQETLEPLGITLTADDLYPLEGMPTERTAQRLTERFLGQA